MGRECSTCPRLIDHDESIESDYGGGGKKAFFKALRENPDKLQAWIEQVEQHEASRGHCKYSKGLGRIRDAKETWAPLFLHQVVVKLVVS